MNDLVVLKSLVLSLRDTEEFLKRNNGNIGNYHKILQDINPLASELLEKIKQLTDIDALESNSTDYNAALMKKDNYLGNAIAPSVVENPFVSNLKSGLSYPDIDHSDRNVYIQSKLKDRWQEYHGRHPPADIELGIDSPIIQNLLSFWTVNEKKIKYLKDWSHSLSKPLPERFPYALQLVRLSQTIKEGFLMLYLPVLRDISIYPLRAYTRESGLDKKGLACQKNPVTATNKSSETPVTEPSNSISSSTIFFDIRIEIDVDHPIQPYESPIEVPSVNTPSQQHMTSESSSDVAAGTLMSPLLDSLSLLTMSWPPWLSVTQTNSSDGSADSDVNSHPYDSVPIPCSADQKISHLSSTSTSSGFYELVLLSQDQFSDNTPASHRDRTEEESSYQSAFGSVTEAERNMDLSTSRHSTSSSMDLSSDAKELKLASRNEKIKSRLEALRQRSIS